MKHVLLSRSLEHEKILADSHIPSGGKVILRSCDSLHSFLEIKDCASAVIDETILNQESDPPSVVLQQLYNAILRNNPKCLVILLYQEESGLVFQLKKKSHYTLFLKKESLSTQKLDYIFTVHKHQQYRSLFIKDLRPKTTAPIDLHIFHPLNQSYPCFIPKGTEIKQEILERLARDNVSQLFIKTGEFSEFLKISQKIYHLFFSEEMHHIRKRYKYFLSDIVDDAEKGEWGKGRHLLDELGSLYSMLSNLVGKFEGPELALKSLIFLRPSPIAQGLNSGIYAIVFSKILGLRDEHELFYSALLYGLGKSEVPPQNNLKSSLDNTNLKLRSCYLRYVENSVKLIKRRKISVSPQVIENIEAHKEYFDGSGYPRGLMGDQIPRNAQLLGIIESFNNLYTFRQNEKFLSLKRAWHTLRENSGNAMIGAKHSPKLLDEIQSRLSHKGVL